MRGYLNRPEETANTIVDGWLHTVTRALRRRWSPGRRPREGHDHPRRRTSTQEIEAVAHQLPEIAETAVVGRPEPRLR